MCQDSQGREEVLGLKLDGFSNFLGPSEKKRIPSISNVLAGSRLKTD
jgi:hypothetical protein